MRNQSISILQTPSSVPRFSASFRSCLQLYAPSCNSDVPERNQTAERTCRASVLTCWICPHNPRHERKLLPLEMQKESCGSADLWIPKECRSSIECFRE